MWESLALEHPVGQRYCLGGNLFSPEVPCTLDIVACCPGQPRKHCNCLCTETFHGNLDCVMEHTDR